MARAIRKISVKAFIADVRAGMDNPGLMSKYSLSERQLEAALNKLIEGGAVDESELYGRTGAPPTDQALTEAAVPARKLVPEPPVSVTQENAKAGPHPNSIVHHNSGPALAVARLLCPACRTPHHEKYAVCPQCGVSPGEYDQMPSPADVKAEKLTGPGKEPGRGKLGRKLAGCITVVNSFTQDTLQILRNTDQPTLGYVWRAWLITFIPSVAIGAIALSVMAIVGYEDRYPDMSLMFLLIGGVLIGPWIETVVMGWILLILNRIIRNVLWVCLVSAVIWGLIHGLQCVAQGFTTTWMFFIFSLAFLEWEKKSRSKAIRAAALIHMCQNGLVFIVVLIFTLVGVEFSQVKKTPPCPAPKTEAMSPVRATQNVQSKEAISTRAPVEPLDHKQAPEMNMKGRIEAFQRAFPDCGEEEFDLAHNDLYPDWKKNFAPNGTWKEFLTVYEDFVKWWRDSGSPAEAGFKLWKDYCARKE